MKVPQGWEPCSLPITWMTTLTQVMLGVGEGGGGLAILSMPQADHPCLPPASLHGARVLLTGVSAGIGEELAYHYARLGPT